MQCDDTGLYPFSENTTNVTMCRVNCTFVSLKLGSCFFVTLDNELDSRSLSLAIWYTLESRVYQTAK